MNSNDTDNNEIQRIAEGSTPGDLPDLLGDLSDADDCLILEKVTEYLWVERSYEESLTKARDEVSRLVSEYNSSESGDDAVLWTPRDFCLADVCLAREHASRTSGLIEAHWELILDPDDEWGRYQGLADLFAEYERVPQAAQNDVPNIFGGIALLKNAGVRAVLCVLDDRDEWI